MVQRQKGNSVVNVSAVFRRFLFVVKITPCLFPQIRMGQNQDKLDGGEQGLEGPEALCPDPGAPGGHVGGGMEAGSFCEEKAGNVEENSEEPNAHDLDESHSQEPITPSNERHINLWASPFAAREVRLGGLAGKEGEGGRTTALGPQETGKNQQSSVRPTERVRTSKWFNWDRMEEKRTEEQLETSSKIQMEHQAEGMILCEEIHDEKHGHDSTDNNESVSMVTSRQTKAAGDGDLTQRAGREFFGSIHEHQNENTIVEEENADIKVCAGTVDRLIEKEPPKGQSQHPLKNRLQKETLLDVSDGIHYRASKEHAENKKKGETSTCEVKAAVNNFSTEPKVSDKPEEYTRVLRHTEAIVPDQTNRTSNPVLPVEASSILERLLKRNRQEATPAPSEMKTADRDSKVTPDVPLEMEAKRIHENDKTVKSTAKTGQSVNATKRTGSSSSSGLKGTTTQHSKDADMKKKADVTSDQLSRPSGIVNTMSSPVNAHHIKTESSAGKSTKVFVDEETEMIPNIDPCEKTSADDFQSDVSDERTSGEVSRVKTLSGKSGVQFCADDISPTRAEQPSPPMKTKSDRFSPLVSATTLISEESLTPVMKQDLHTTPHQPDKKTSRDENVIMREKSPSSPRSRPVSELIKETIVLHEKLQHQDWSKPPEVKCDEQGHSVKVAQMKAAFDSAQKSPDKAIERKTSVRKGMCFHILPVTMNTTADRCRLCRTR